MTAAAPERPVHAVVTGLGVVAPNGLGTEAYWAATLEGRGGIGRITRFDPGQYPARLAGEVRGFDPAAHLPGRLLPQTDHMTRLALVASDWALTEAGLDPSALPEYGIGVVTAAASGGFDFGHRELEKLWSRGPEHVSAYQSFAWFYAVNTGQISIRHGLRGPSGVIVTDQAGGLDAVAQARRQLRKGGRAVLTGGVDSALCPWGWVAQLAGGRVSVSDDPARAYLPFDAAASGHVPGEGGAILLLEDAARAGARPYGEIAGYAAGFDPPPGTGRPPVLRRVIEQALADAGEPGVDVVFADGAAMAAADRAEAEALAAVFGPCGVPVTVPKTMTGRLYSGGAALDLATALLALRDQVIPPTVNVTAPAPGLDLDLVTGTARPAALRTALVLARGHGGFTSAVIVRTYS
ncbi:ketosynthase chain-length factor [Nonomuraea sp. NPDC050451]|uniref:ketosynthase chain-length factor n=1 Tax=Nonomuraea sp. NPDC050451 TaxID=3364364 RepID=UPI0037AECD9A